MSGPVILLLKAQVKGYVRADGTAVRPHQRVTTFRSGASAPSIFAGYAAAKVPIGVSLAELSPGSATWPQLFDYARAGGEVFVDTGAFTAFTKKRPMDWQAITRTYRMLMERGQGARLRIVAPDVIGDQAASLDLLAQHRQVVRDMIAAGHDVLVPVQRGAMPPYEAWRRAVAILGTDDFTASVPSRAEAFTAAELANLMGGPDKPRRVHLLGVAGNLKKLAGLVGIIHGASPDTLISSDANRLRAMVGEGRPITEERRKLRRQFDAAARSVALPDDPPEATDGAPAFARRLAQAVALMRDPPELRQARVDNLDRIYARPIQAGAIQRVEAAIAARQAAQPDLFAGPR